MHDAPSRLRIALLTTAAMLAFAGNSLLGRLALAEAGIDPASFTALRLGAGALMLLGLSALRRGPGERGSERGGWPSALALFAYAAAFSFAYVRLPTGLGALVLFGMVQLTMVGWGLYRGERLGWLQSSGFGLALLGLGVLTFPGSTAPDMGGVLLMAVSGVAWGAYSLRGRHSVDPLRATTASFVRACIPGLFLWVWAGSPGHAVGTRGAALAVASGALTSGLGYALWYAALRGLASTQAALVQLSVPVLASLGGVALLGEAVSWRLAIAGVAILAGIALGRSARGT